MRKFLLLLTIFTFAILIKLHAQKGIIEGQLIDSASSKPIVYATVSIYRASDTTLINYKLSDEKGTFQISQLPTALQLRIVITYTGNVTYRKEFSLANGGPKLSLGKILMQATSTTLNEVIIKAERPPVIVRKDTIEFNAASFKTLPDALVEDLLRKLPGVNVDKDGNILVNGKRVSTIYVDGKDFFGGDVRIASKNLPANTIEKVQVMNDAEALRFNPLMPEADSPQVINLKLKPGIKKGAFGKIYAGGGVKDKIEAGALVNLFRDTTQISILGYGNNLNKAAFAFTDIRSVGGFGRSGWGNANGNGNGGLSIDKVSFGGFGSGLMESTGGGGNFNTIINKKVLFSLNYFYGAVKSDYDELKNTQQTYNDTLLTTRQNMKLKGNNYAHLLGTKVAFNIFPWLRFETRPQIVFTKDRTDQVYNINSTSNFKGLLNTSVNDQQNNNDGTTFIAWTKLMPTFKKKGRTLDILNTTTIDDAQSNLFNQVENAFFIPPMQSTLYQLRKNNTLSVNVFNMISYNDILDQNLALNASLYLSYFKNRNDLGTFFPNELDQYLIPIPTLSEDFLRTGLRSQFTTTLRWKVKKFTISPGIGISSLNTKNNFSTSPVINQNFNFILPTFDIGYGIFSLNYQASYREVDIANLQPVVNNTNPLFIRNGNPDLKPAFNNSLRLSLRKYDTKRNMTYNASISGTTIKDATIISRTINGAGVQTTLPINNDGNWNLTNSLSFQKDWKLANNKQLSFIASNSSSFNQSQLILNSTKSSQKTFTVRPSTEIRINLNDKVEFNQSYSFTNFQSNYQSTDFNNQSLTYHDSRTEVIYRIAQKIIWETNLDYRYNSNAIPGLLKSYYKWNAGVTYVFLKGNKGQLKLAVNDILDQNIIASRIIRENWIEDMQGSTIRRHGLLTFTYNIRDFGEKIGGRNKLF